MHADLWQLDRVCLVLMVHNIKASRTLYNYHELEPYHGRGARQNPSSRNYRDSCHDLQNLLILYDMYYLINPWTSFVKKSIFSHSMKVIS